MCLVLVRRCGIRGDPGLLPHVYNPVAVTELLTVKWDKSETVFISVCVSLIDAL